MPRRKYGRKKGKKARSSYYRRKKAYYSKKLLPPSRKLGFPRQQAARFRYVDHLAILDPSAGATAIYQYRANGPYDSNYSGSGHQCLGWDEWTQFYNHYVTIGSKITVQFMTDTTNVAPAVFFLYLSDDTTIPYTDPTTIQEQGNVSYIVGAAGTNTNSRAMTLRKGFSAKKFFNIKDVRDNVLRIGAAVDSVPTDQAFFTIGYAPIDASTDLPALYCSVTIDYTVVFSEPKDLAQS